ncbi:MAG: glutamate racemase [Treponema sp.]|jgi:glutamate racemase|nr:glutamate racemase [Treponema sp.]
MNKQSVNSKPILFIDSGIGGLPYCVDFHKKNLHEEVCYLADTKNFPYGPREKNELASILINLTEKLISTLNPKIIVLACNTATIAALSSLREQYPEIPFVGTVPALKPAAKTSNTGKVGVLGTERTIQEIQNLHLIDDTCQIIGIAASELVEFIERHFYEASEKEKNKIAKKYIELFRAEGVDSLVLGCTHFLFLQEEFSREGLNPDFTPKIKVFDSLEGITKRIESLLDENSGILRAADDNNPVHRLVLTGETQDAFWHNRASSLGFQLSLL